MTQFVTSKDGVRIAYDSTGEGRPIVLIHGFASSREQNWRTPGWIDALAAAGFRAVSFDCRGHGKSDKPHDPDLYGENMIDDILAVMDAADAWPADVMGYSMGGMLTIRLLMKFPERVRRAVTAGIGATYFSEAPAWRAMIAKAVETDNVEAIEDRAARRFPHLRRAEGQRPCGAGGVHALAAAQIQRRRIGPLQAPGAGGVR